MKLAKVISKTFVALVIVLASLLFSLFYFGKVSFLSKPKVDQSAILAQVGQDKITENGIGLARKASRFNGSNEELLEAVIEFYLLKNYFAQKLIPLPDETVREITKSNYLGVIPPLRELLGKIESLSYEARLVSVIYCNNIEPGCRRNEERAERRRQGIDLLQFFREELRSGAGFGASLASLSKEASESGFLITDYPADFRRSITGQPLNDFEKEAEAKIEKVAAEGVGEKSTEMVERVGYDVSTVYLKEVSYDASFSYAEWLSREKLKVKKF